MLLPNEINNKEYRSSSGLVDPYLRLFNKNGELIAFDDDSGPSYNSLIEFLHYVQPILLTYSIPFFKIF